MNAKNNKILTQKIEIQYLGKQDYQSVVQKMQQFTLNRDDSTNDEIWVTEHDPIFTLGFNAKEENIISDSEIPIIRTDRGGQVTYHGPGQIVIYFMIDIKRRQIGIRNLVRLIEHAIINLLDDYNIISNGDIKAPGVYVQNKKIAALGLRVKQKGTYHGLALNVDMDLNPYQLINPCGVKNAKITQLKDFNISDDIHTISEKLITKIILLFDSV